MKSSASEQTIDVTGLSAEAIAAIESLVAAIRGSDWNHHRQPDTSLDAWSQLLHSWAANHPSHPTVADDSRESIYEGRGE